MPLKEVRLQESPEAQLVVVHRGHRPTCSTACMLSGLHAKLVLMATSSAASSEAVGMHEAWHGSCWRVWAAGPDME